MQRQSSGTQTRAIAFLVISLLLGGIASAVVVAVWKNSQAVLAEAKKPRETTEVVVAIRDLYMGLPIGPEDVEVRSVQPEMIPRDVTFASLGDVLGRTPRERILTNEPIRKERLAQPDVGIGLNAIVTPGKRAMTIATDTETAVAGLLQAGNYVDIIVTIKPDDPAAAGAKWATETILQGIKVLAVGSVIEGADERPTVDAKGNTVKKPATDPSKKNLRPSITLEVTPDEAEKLALASSRGEITVVLRSDIDILQIDSPGPVTTSKLIGFDAPAADVDPTPIKRRAPGSTPPIPTATTAAGTAAEVISGGSSTTVHFDADGSKSETTTKGGKNR
jgi:pilus assembly protein CpaB